MPGVNKAGGQRGRTKYWVFTGTAPKEHYFKEKKLSIAALLVTMNRYCWKRLYGRFPMYVQGYGYVSHYRCTDTMMSYSFREHMPLIVFIHKLFHTTVKRKWFNCSKHYASDSKAKKMLPGELILFLLWKRTHFLEEQGLSQLFRLCFDYICTPEAQGGKDRRKRMLFLSKQS